MIVGTVGPGPKANARGLFAGDWATDDKVSMLTETSIIFSSCQKIIEQEQERQRASCSVNPANQFITPTHIVQYIHRISNLYRDKLRQYIDKLEVSEDEMERTDLEYTVSFSLILHFAETIYIPADGRGTGVVGEEILHWLNSFDVQPTTEEAQEIAQSATPYEHGNYWDCIRRFVSRGMLSAASSLLSYLAKGHPSAKLRQFSEEVCNLLTSMPRSTRFTLEHDFLASHRRWVGRARSSMNKLEMEMDELEAEWQKDGRGGKSVNEIEEERFDLEAQFNCLLGLMIGQRDRVSEVCRNWRELLGAWGLLVQPGIKRDDIPEIIKIILDAFPIKSSGSHLSEENLLISLAKGETVDACKQAQKYDPWLAAHMTDLLDRLGLLEEDDEMEEDSSDLTMKNVEKSKNEKYTLRQQTIEEYAETVLDDQCFWRLALCYLSFCGPSARLRMRNIILDVALTDPEVLASNTVRLKRAEDVMLEAAEDEMDELADDPEQARKDREEEKSKENDSKRILEQYSTAMEVIETCVELNMQLEARAICKHLAGEMVKKDRMGAALAFCVRAQDIRQIKRIADSIFEIYITQGCDAFCAMVDSIPLSLLNRASQQMDEDGINTINSSSASDDLTDKIMPLQNSSFQTSRLLFLAKYRDFHRLHTESDLRSAAALLVELLTSNLVPEPYRAVLLVDSLPFLQSDIPMLTSRESYELLRLLDEILTASATHPLQAEYYLTALERIVSPSGKHASEKKEQQRRRQQKNVNGSNHDAIGADELPSHAVNDPVAAIRRLDILRLLLARNLAKNVVT
ncbi:hypothetical protein L7F22_019785 [Adiantum nelumboides]|nr:hypothetical protein [Adiantum nelumboides]